MLSALGLFLPLPTKLSTMRFCAAAAVVACLVGSVASTAWIPSSVRAEKRNSGTPASQGFVTTNNGQFQVNGQPFFYFATDAYWLMQLSDADIDLTLKSIAAKNITVVRTWAFNDVFEIPTVGAWFQAFNPNGTITINTGPNGLQRLDTILASAKTHGLMIQLALTNNWNPARNFDPLGPLLSDLNSTLAKRAGTVTNVTHPPGFLSNDYGGMDAYVRAHNLTEHDQFFTNQTLINAFQNYLNVLVPRYANNTELLTWELANDARCNSTLPNSPTCVAQNVTQWHATIATHVKTLDPNHIISSGSQGFFCVDCPKLFPLAPRPQPSPTPGAKRRSNGPLTAKAVLTQRRASMKRNAEAARQRREGAAEKRARGENARWAYRGPVADKHPKRQLSTQNVGPAFDGSQGVDSQDILNIPDIGFSTFQLFPDQNVYAPLDPNLDAFNNTVQAGIEWITMQAQSALTFGKPVSLTGFGLVTQNNLPAFTLFNSSQPFLPLNASGVQPQIPLPTALGVGLSQGQLPLTDQQQQIAYSSWIQSAISNDVAGITQYQWGQENLTAPTQNVAPAQSSTNTFTPALGQQNISPNDGYQAISPSLQNLFQATALQQAAKNVG
ncbi:glycoside hydrolase superfamily [Gautieria morchelliformis]|nr:glycoside hydrolase superfamily [Gautieria morchelliformis]